MIEGEFWKAGLAIMSGSTLLVAGVGTALGFGVRRVLVTVFKRA